MATGYSRSYAGFGLCIVAGSGAGSSSGIGIGANSGIFSWLGSSVQWFELVVRPSCQNYGFIMTKIFFSIQFSMCLLMKVTNI